MRNPANITLEAEAVIASREFSIRGKWVLFMKDEKIHCSPAEMQPPDVTVVLEFSENDVVRGFTKFMWLRIEQKIADHLIEREVKK